MNSAYTCMACGAKVPDLGPMKTPYRCEACVAKNRTLTQRMAEAGYKRRPTHRSLPKDDDE